MISVTDCFFFPQDKEWLHSLSSNKFYKMSISSLYRVSLLRASLVFPPFADFFFAGAPRRSGDASSLKRHYARKERVGGKC